MPGARNKVLMKMQQQGVTLIELILAMVIIAIMLVVAVRYYGSTRSAQRVNEGVHMVQEITNAAESWFSTYKSFASPQISVSALYNQGLLPSAFDPENSVPNSWRGAVAVTPKQGDATKVTIQVNGLDKSECLSLCEIMNTKNVDGGADCTTNCAADQQTGKSVYKGDYPKTP